MKKKILVTDDSPTIVEMIKATLEGEGYDVVTACDGQDALAKAHGEKPDLIIMDLMLPKMDGNQVCAMLKHNEEYKKIPVIILTARAGEADKKISEDAKADAYFTKPFEPEQLLGKIGDLLKS